RRPPPRALPGRRRRACRLRRRHRRRGRGGGVDRGSPVGVSTARPGTSRAGVRVIELRGCEKVYPARARRPPVAALAGIDLVIRDREIVSILGPSGCGKTTLLRIVAGLVQCSAGEVLIDGRRVTGPGRDRAMVFQHFALLPWADVLANVAFGLELRGVSRAERERIAAELVRTVGLAGFERHLPWQLSGGMQQRVGLARALAIGPQTLLMDEPFSAVDAQTRRDLQEDLLRLHAERAPAVLFVTHSM